MINFKDLFKSYIGRSTSKIDLESVKNNIEQSLTSLGFNQTVEVKQDVLEPTKLDIKINITPLYYNYWHNSVIMSDIICAPQFKLSEQNNLSHNWTNAIYREVHLASDEKYYKCKDCNFCKYKDDMVYEDLSCEEYQIKGIIK